MRFVTGLADLAMACGLFSGGAQAGAFDGSWVAERPPLAKPCNATTLLTMVVSGNSVSGRLQAPWSNASFSGTIGADGTGPIMMDGAKGTVRFSGDRFEINWVGGRCGSEVAMGDRAPDDDQTKSIADQRRQQQQTYADLMVQANAGSKIDYTALRSAYVFAETWEPYGNKTDSLMLEATAAQKGGDCAGAMEKLDAVLKEDFIIDAAHALRADCLKAAGDKAGADRENAIADGLIHSLMDSGDGATEKSAYVVVSEREERDVLANRSIQVQTRSTQLRGSNGHYYDEIQGIDTSWGIAAKPMFFDVSSFVAGRESRRAAVTIAQASVH